VVAVPVPGGRSLVGKVIGAVAARASRKGRPSRAAAVIREHLLTVAALGAGVTDGFLHSTGWGLGALVAALLVLDFKIQG
jgi:hypothetical protein